MTEPNLFDLIASCTHKLEKKYSVDNVRFITYSDWSGSFEYFDYDQKEDVLVVRFGDFSEMLSVMAEIMNS